MTSSQVSQASLPFLGSISVALEQRLHGNQAYAS